MNISTFQLVSINACLFLFNTLLIYIGLPKLLSYINIRNEIIRGFIYENDGFFVLAFISLFASEQFLLIIFTSFIDNPIILKFIISIFALLVVTTAYLQSFILKKKSEYDKSRELVLRKSIYTIPSLRLRIKKLDEELKELKK